MENLEIKSVQTASFASEETVCYEAKLYLRGKYVADCRNDGHGGPDDIHWRDAGAEKEVEAYFAALPAEVYHGVDIQPDLEMWLQQQAGAYMEAKRLKGMCGKKIIGLRGDDIVSWKASPKLLPEIAPRLLERNPGVALLNGKSTAEIAAILVAKENEAAALAQAEG